MSNLPFLKWAGGKRWLAPRLGVIIGASVAFRFVEPFLGSGSVFFALAPSKALLADSNSELIAAFRGVRDDPNGVLSGLQPLQINKQSFDSIRSSRPRKDTDRAIRLIYLNRTGFNGLYRVNRRNEFNVPFGCKPGTKLVDSPTLTAASQILRSAALKCQDFRKTLAAVRASEDVVYIDPPYTVKHDSNGFRRYNDNIFTWKDQEDLAILLTSIVSAGGKVVISNAHHHEVKRLYPSDIFHAIALQRASRKTRALDQAAPLAGWKLPECFAELRRLLEATRQSSNTGGPSPRNYQAVRLRYAEPADECSGPRRDTGDYR
jgi:DNA adenine methylase